MTANELADKLHEIYTGTDYEEIKEAATMLRQQQAELDAFKLNYYNTGYSLQLRDKDETIKQQQAEIGRLKQIIDANNLQSDIGQLDTRSYLIGRYDGLRNLTDEEITEIGLAHGAFFTESKHHLWGDDLEIHDFARAILKKASDK